MRNRRGAFCSGCLGCLGLLAALLFISWWMTPSRVKLPPVPSDVEYSLSSGPRRLLVSRSQNMAALVDGPITYLRSLAGDAHDKYGNPLQEAWIVNRDRQTYVHYTAERPRRLGSALGGRFRDLWRQEVGNRDALVWSLLGPPQSVMPLAFRYASSKESGRGTWEGQPALMLTFAYRARGGSGVGAMLPGPWHYYYRGYVPGLGFNLDGGEGQTGPFSSPWNGLKVGPIAPAEFQVPADYQEQWSDRELTSSTPRLPDPPVGYRAIGGTDVHELKDGTIEVRTTWMQDNTPKGRYSGQLYVYFLPAGQSPEALLKAPNMKWLGFKEWDARPLVPDQTARTGPDRLLLQRHRALARLDLHWFDPVKPGQRKPPPGSETEAVLRLLAGHLAAGLNWDGTPTAQPGPGEVEAPLR